MAETPFRIRAIVLRALLMLGLSGASASGAVFYVSPDGSSRASGSQSSPWSISKAFSAPCPVRPGDTVYLRGGSYVLGQDGLSAGCAGTSARPITYRSYPGEWAVLIAGGKSGDPYAIHVPRHNEHLHFRDFEITSSVRRRWSVSASTPQGLPDAFTIGASHTKVINVVIHDVAQAFPWFGNHTGGEIYGVVSSHVGYDGPNGDRGHGHHVYSNHNGPVTKIIRDGFFYGGFRNLWDLRVSCDGATSGAHNRNYLVEGNSAMEIGQDSGFKIASASVMAYCSDGRAPLTDVAIRNNRTWNRPDLSLYAGPMLGYHLGYRGAGCSNVTVTDNFVSSGRHAMQLGTATSSNPKGNCRDGIAAMTGNTFHGTRDSGVRGFVPNDFPSNTYVTYPATPAAKVWVVPNAYERGRAMVTIWNPRGASSVAVDLKTVLADGAAYKVCNAANFSGGPVGCSAVAGGSFRSASPNVSFPTTGLTMAPLQGEIIKGGYCADNSCDRCGGASPCPNTVLSDPALPADRRFNVYIVMSGDGSPGPTPSPLPTPTPAPLPVPAPLPAPASNGLTGEYYDSTEFSNLVATRLDATVDFDWGTGRAVSALRSDTFSVRWTGEVEPRFSETYRFYTQSDDGVRLWVNGRLLVDNWSDHPLTEDSGTIALTGGRRYPIRMEFYENREAAVARLLWKSPSTPKAVIPRSRLFARPGSAVAATGGGTGLTGEYYESAGFSTLAAARVDPTVNFDWGTGRPHSALSTDTFSVRWSGQVEPRFSETYTFYTRSDDGVRLWVNGRLLVDNWSDHPLTEDSGTIALAGGQKYAIRMEFYENRAEATAKLLWKSPSTPKAVIPQNQLYP